MLAKKYDEKSFVNTKYQTRINKPKFTDERNIRILSKNISRQKLSLNTSISKSKLADDSY